MAAIENEEEFLDMQEELLDRFGDMPVSVNNLLNIAYLKSICHSVYVTSLVHKNDEIKLVMYNKAKLKVELIPELIQKYQPALKLIPETNPYFVYTLKKNAKTNKIDILNLFEGVKNLLDDMKRLL
jgi:transcription-repair coupling factor (superfamily II helicase)